MNTLAALALLSLLVTQDEEDKLVLDDLGITLFKPANYTKVRREEHSPLMRFLLRSPSSDLY